MFYAKVKGRVFQILGIDYITSGSVGLQIGFEFDNEWAGLEKYATFEAGTTEISVILENDACVIPWEVLEDPNVNLRIGIRGSNGDDVVIPTIWREYEIHEGAKFSEDSGSPASVTLIEQLSARMDALEENGGVDIFWATYGLSSYEEIYEQSDLHDRLVVCHYTDRTYIMQKEVEGSTTAYKFFAPDFDNSHSRMYWLMVDDDDQWTNGYSEVTGGSGISPYTSNPAALGNSASPGSSNDYARGDHVHPKPTPSDIGAYSMPSGGIPATDLASTIQTSLGKADSAYQKPSGGIPSTDLEGGIGKTKLGLPVQASLELADSAYQKPSGGIPATDLATDVANKIVYIQYGVTTASEINSLVAFGKLPVVIYYGLCYMYCGYSTISGTSYYSFYSVNGFSSDPTIKVYVIHVTGSNVWSTDTLTVAKIPSGGTADQVLKKASSTNYDMVWGSVSGGTTEIFDAVYGTTTVSEIETAISNGKLLRCTYDGQQYYLGFTATSLIRSYIFFKSSGNEVNVCGIDADTGVWSHGYRTIPSAYNSNPAMNGTASPGSSTFYARGDHVHPSEILWATYGTTPYSDIAAAVAANKAVLCVYNAHVYYLTGCSSNPNLPVAEFTSTSGTNVDCWLKCNGSTWTNGTVRVAPEEVTISTAGDVSKSLDAGKIYHFTGALTSLTVTLTAPDAGNVAQYHFDFDSGSTAPTLTLPNTVTMPSGFQVEASKHYEIDILDGYGVVQSW